MTTTAHKLCVNQRRNQNHCLLLSSANAHTNTHNNRAEGLSPPAAAKRNRHEISPKPPPRNWCSYAQANTNTHTRARAHSHAVPGWQIHIRFFMKGATLHDDRSSSHARSSRSIPTPPSHFEGYSESLCLALASYFCLRVCVCVCVWTNEHKYSTLLPHVGLAQTQLESNENLLTSITSMEALLRAYNWPVNDIRCSQRC